jgi:hypothetical protein
MPDNIAFDLMKDALKIKPEAQADWENKLDDLQDFTKKSERQFPIARVSARMS